MPGAGPLKSRSVFLRAAGGLGLLLLGIVLLAAGSCMKRLESRRADNYSPVSRGSGRTA